MSLKGIIAIGIAVVVWVGLVCWKIDRESKRAELQRLDAYANGYAKGLSEGSAICPSPADPDVTLARQVEDLRAEVDACAGTMQQFADYKRTEAANRANAHDLGLNEGLRMSREDWTVQAWECPR